jgi:hypothetical protein
LLSLALECVNLMLLDRKQISMERVASFVKRLATVSLHVPTHVSIGLIATVRLLMQVWEEFGNVGNGCV